MAYTALTHRADALGSGGGTTTAIDTSGADLLILAVATDTGVILVAGDISDSKSNATWVLAGGNTYGGGSVLHVFYHLAPTVGSGHTFTVTKASSFCAAAVSCYSGSHAAPFDDEDGDSGSGTIQPLGAMTPSVNDCLVFSALSLPATSTITPPSGFTALDEVAFGGTFGISAAYLIQTTATSTQPAWTSTAGSAMGVQAVIFKPATGGGSPSGGGGGPLIGGRLIR